SGDDDGVVDAMVFEFLEVSASCGGPSIWPHRSSISNWNDEPFVTDDPGFGGESIVVNGYIIQGVTDCGGNQVQSAGTVSHEFGHVLGLPDYYHPIDGIEPQHRRWVLGCWALMAAGSWGCGPVGTLWPFPGPSHMISWSKHWLGWLDYVDVGPVHDAEYVLDPVETSGTALRIPLDPAGAENLLIEFRERSSFDVYLPDTGILVVHQDFEGALRPQSGNRYFLRMEEADGDASLLHTLAGGGSRGEASDAFGVDGVAGRMNAETNPSTRRNTGLRSTVTIHSMTLDGGRARIRVSTAPDPVVIVPEEGVATPQISPFERRLRIAGGSAPYVVSFPVAPPAGVSARAAQDELVLEGEPAELGSFELTVQVADFWGVSRTTTVPLIVDAFFVDEARLLVPLLGTPGPGLTPAERSHLDALGNANGSFDIGDARAWLTGG
ncbi:MAG TPA: immune inhibitor A domain-containing protein, partial [Longimicrobiales bacterium]